MIESDHFPVNISKWTFWTNIYLKKIWHGLQKKVASQDIDFKVLGELPILNGLLFLK